LKIHLDPPKKDFMLKKITSDPAKFFLYFGVGLFIYFWLFFFLTKDCLGGESYSFPNFHNVILQSIFLAAVSFSPLSILVFIIYLPSNYFETLFSYKQNLLIITLFLMLFCFEIVLYNVQAIEYLHKKPEFFYYEFVYISNPFSWHCLHNAKIGMILFFLGNLIYGFWRVRKDS
jgi:hypothetical protein